MSSSPMMRTMFSRCHTRAGMIPVRWSGIGGNDRGCRCYSFESREKAAASDANVKRRALCVFLWACFVCGSRDASPWSLQSLLPVQLLLGFCSHMCQISSTPHISLS